MFRASPSSPPVRRRGLGLLGVEAGTGFNRVRSDIFGLVGKVSSRRGPAMSRRLGEWIGDRCLFSRAGGRGGNVRWWFIGIDPSLPMQLVHSPPDVKGALFRLRFTIENSTTLPNFNDEKIKLIPRSRK